MIIGILHQGSGLGNQLHRLVATRVKAADLGVDWQMIYHPDGSGKEQGFKGKSFMNIGWNEEQAPKSKIEHFLTTAEGPELFYNRWDEKMVNDEICGVDTRSYDPEFNFIEDNTVIDGEFQDERYWERREKEVNEWLKVEPLEMPDDLCVIGFRGGEFSLYPDLFLTKEYWNEAITRMLKINPKMRFEVHTDDKPLAQQFFPEFQVIHDIGLNWRSMRYAKYAIIANSSFFILPRWLRQGEEHVVGATFEILGTDKDFNGKPISALKMVKDAITIAPRYWGRRNTKIWSLPQNYYKRFLYI